jgi:NADPH:quinone reductase-like Zn-dependent oxidoreductase
MSYGGSIAISGNAGGLSFSSTVLPFILRGVSVLGIDSVMLPLDRRIAIWQRLATNLRPPHLDETIAQEVTLDEAPAVLEQIVRGETRGRTVVRIAG